MVSDLSHSPCWCSPLLNHKLRIRSTRHLHRLSINNQRLRTPQTQRPTHPHPAIRRRNRSVPPHRKTNRIRVRRTTPNRHTRHRETLLLRQPRNRRLPPRRSLAHHKTRQLHTLTIMHLPMRRQFLNLSSKILRRQFQHSTRRGLGTYPPLWLPPGVADCAPPSTLAGGAEGLSSDGAPGSASASSSVSAARALIVVAASSEGDTRKGRIRMRAARIATLARVSPRRDDAGAWVCSPWVCSPSPTSRRDDNASAHANNPTPDARMPSRADGGTNDP